jgi:type 1 glutamine amidotransferase
MISYRRLKNPSIAFIVIILIIAVLSCTGKDYQDMDRILIITGGHDFEQSFYAMFDSFTDVQYDTIVQPNFNQMITEEIPNQYSALVFYDMFQEITEDQKRAYFNLLDKGQGIVYLHHSLVSYQHWDDYIKIVGGKYIETAFYDDPEMKGSTYKEDITLEIKVDPTEHPVTQGIKNFAIYDEGYNYIEMIPGITPLLKTKHPDCTHTIAWAHTYSKSRIVYILLGHGPEAHENENYRKLVKNAIDWVGGSH